jgi:hypothetical protein
MVAIDPRTASPSVWSLSPADTLGLIFWTKNPTNLLLDQKLLDPYRTVVQMTITGWGEVEKGAPSLDEAGRLLIETSRAYEHTYWRFSPIPQLPEHELYSRFQRLLAYASIAGLRHVFVSYLQNNDGLPETRGVSERFDLLNALSEEAKVFGLQTILCADDQSFIHHSGALFRTGACVFPTDFDGSSHVMDCGCVVAIDPFTVNESCNYGCAYCYVGDKTLSPKKRNTTPSRLPVTRG